MSCSNNLKQIGLGMHNYVTLFNRFPPGQMQPCSGCKTISWCTFFLDWIEQNALSERMDYKKQPWGPENRAIVSVIIPTYICPSVGQHDSTRTEDHRISLDIINPGTWDAGEGEEMACIDYGGITGPRANDSNTYPGGLDFKNPITNSPYPTDAGMLLTTQTSTGRRQVHVRKVTDGLSKTMIVGECAGRGIDTSGSNALKGVWAGGQNVFSVGGIKSGRVLPWINAEPPTDAWNSDEMRSDHPGGAHGLLCDGSVHFLSAEIDFRVFMALATRDGGETVDAGSF